MSSQSPTTSSSTPGSAAPSHPQQHPQQPAKLYSCALCKQRKVKCDKKQPCSACVRSGAECIPVIPQPPRRGKRKFPFDDNSNTTSNNNTTARNNSNDEEPKGVITLPPERKKSGTSMPGRFISQNGNSRYLESNIWTNLTDEFRDKTDILRVSSEVQTGEDPSGFLLGVCANAMLAPVDLAALHPDPAHVFLLWQKFLDNVNPLSKIVHAPTLQQKVAEAATNPGKLSKPMAALMFSIYFVSAISMTAQEIQTGLGMEREACLVRYRSAAERALGEAKFLRTLDLTVLQAFLLYLLAIRVTQDSGTFWVLCGVAVRIAMRMGLHKDGEALNLPPFEVEMRRRISIQIRHLDGRASGADASGGPAVSIVNWDTHPPRNANDADIYPEMTTPPAEHNGLTEMSFIHLRASFGEFLIRKFGGDWNSLWSDPAITFADKKAAIDELESQLEKRFVSLCNPAVPLHQFITALARAIISRMRIAALHPRYYKTMPKSDRDTVIKACVRMLALDNSVYKNPDAQRYIWHIQVHFQSDALIIVLSEVRRMMNEAPEDAEAAWVEIEEVYEHHPELMNGSPLHVAVGNLAVKAWDHRESEYRRRGVEYKTPGFIETLRARLKKDEDATGGVEIGLRDEEGGTEGGGGSGGGVGGSSEGGGGNGVGTRGEGGGSPIYADDALPEAAPIDWSPLEWQYWDELMRNYGVAPGS